MLLSTAANSDRPTLSISSAMFSTSSSLGALRLCASLRMAAACCSDHSRMSSSYSVVFVILALYHSTVACGNDRRLTLERTRMGDLWQLSATDLAALIRSCKVSARE